MSSEKIDKVPDILLTDEIGKNGGKASMDAIFKLV